MGGFAVEGEIDARIVFNGHGEVDAVFDVDPQLLPILRALSPDSFSTRRGPRDCSSSEPAWMSVSFSMGPHLTGSGSACHMKSTMRE